MSKRITICCLVSAVLCTPLCSMAKSDEANEIINELKMFFKEGSNANVSELANRATTIAHEEGNTKVAGELLACADVLRRGEMSPLKFWRQTQDLLKLEGCIIKPLPAMGDEEEEDSEEQEVAENEEPQEEASEAPEEQEVAENAEPQEEANEAPEEQEVAENEEPKEEAGEAPEEQEVAENEEQQEEANEVPEEQEVAENKEPQEEANEAPEEQEVAENEEQQEDVTEEKPV